MSRRHIVLAGTVLSLVAVSLGCRRAPHDRFDRFEHEPVGTAESGSVGKPFLDSALRPRGDAASSLPLEGALDVQLRGGTSEPVQYAVNGDEFYLRTRLAGATAGAKGIDVVVDTSKQKATVLLHDRKQLVEVDLADIGARLKERVASAALERDGTTSTVAGRPCEEWVVRDREYRVSACVAKSAPYLDVAAVEKHAGLTAPDWMHRIADAGYVPLRLKIVDAKGGLLFSSQLSGVPRKVESWKLQIPAGYEKTGASAILGSALKSRE